MNIETIMEFFYERASKRIKESVEKSGKKHSEIHNRDSKQISRIINNQRTRRNSFLITDAIISSYETTDDGKDSEKIGLLHKLDFKTIKEILWGTDEEIKDYLPDLFKLLWNELPNIDSEYHIDKKLILCDYVPYAENSVYFDLCFSSEHDLPYMTLYGRSAAVVLHNQEKFRQEAIDYLYLKCEKQFEKMFNDFCAKTDSFHKINKTIKDKFIDTVFINLLKKNIPNEHSLGLRIKTIIECDLTQSAKLISEYTKTGHINEQKKKLLNAASTYALRLKEIQEDEIKNLKSN